MPRNNNDAYALDFVGKFLEGYSTGRLKRKDYQEKLAKNELAKKQQDFENELKINTALKDVDAAGRQTEYWDKDGVKHVSQPLTADQTSAMRGRVLNAVKTRGYNPDRFAGQPGLPPLPVPAAESIPPSIARPPEQLPPLPSQAPLPAPGVPVPAKIAKFPQFPDDSSNVRQSAEERRAVMGLSDDYRKDSKPFSDTVESYQDARQAYSRAQLAASTGQSSSVADKALLFSMVRAQNGSRPTDKDVDLAIRQGDAGEQVANWYSLAVQGKMTQKMRDDIFKLTRDAMVSKEKEFSTNVESEYTKKARVLAPGIDPSVIVTKKRPVDWDKIKSEYDKEYAAPSAKQAELDSINKRIAELEASQKKKK